MKRVAVGLLNKIGQKNKKTGNIVLFDANTEKFPKTVYRVGQKSYTVTIVF